jgi:hypothetical protein
MPSLLVVETGSIVAGANTYVSLSEVNSYHSVRGNSAWAALASDTIRENCILRAMDYIEKVYHGLWKGYLVNMDQPLAWPRAFAKRADSTGYAEQYYSQTVIPPVLKSAVCELSLISSTEDLVSNEEKRTIREKIDVVEVEYAPSATSQTNWKTATLWLNPLLNTMPNMVEIRK